MYSIMSLTELRSLGYEKWNLSWSDAPYALIDDDGFRTPNHQAVYGFGQKPESLGIALVEADVCTIADSVMIELTVHGTQHRQHELDIYESHGAFIETALGDDESATLIIFEDDSVLARQDDIDLVFSSPDECIQHYIEREAEDRTIEQELADEFDLQKFQFGA